jgi:glycosyltransferase involved in cell wall biosynthesis
LAERNQLLYIGDNPPNQGWGSPIVVRRHLERLCREEWQIRVASLRENCRGCEVPEEWDLVTVPRLRLLGRLRVPGAYRLVQSFWRRRLCSLGKRADCVLAFLDKDFSVVAGRVAKRLGVPLNVFVLDHRETWEKSPTYRQTMYEQTEALLLQAARVWFVSERLVHEYGEHIRLPAPEVRRVLRPIPAGGEAPSAVWSDQFARKPVVVHAGAIQTFHRPVVLALADALAEIGGSLVLVEKTDNPTAQACAVERENVTHVPFFPTNREAVEFVSKATAALHMYSFSDGVQGWATASFPSKLIEFSQTGIPVLLLSPPGTALHDWARECQWEGLCDELSAECLGSVLARLRTRDGWEQMARQSRQVASGEFCAERIQEQFERELVVAPRAG